MVPMLPTTSVFTESTIPPHEVPSTIIRLPAPIDDLVAGRVSVKSFSASESTPYAMSKVKSFHVSTGFMPVSVTVNSI